jgi:formylmethanofuran dehydrogenase subunit B
VRDTARVVSGTTCLGCGVACDDIEVVAREGRILEARNACPLGVAWFGEGHVPSIARIGGREVAVDDALDEGATLLTSTDRVLVYLAAELSCESQREGVAIADELRASLDSLASSTVANQLLVTQRRGRAGATLGEVRNRGDLIVFWAVDPGKRYPRYPTRVAPDPDGLFVPAERTVLGVDVGSDRAPQSTRQRLRFTPEDEVAALAITRAVVLERKLENVEHRLVAQAGALAQQLMSARYAVLVCDGEPSAGRDPRRIEALTALVQSLNARTRAALSVLRAGGNRNGAESVMTSQTGFPMSVDFSRGVPRYRPDDNAPALLARGDVDVMLVLGDPASLPEEIARFLQRVRTVLIGPRTSVSKLGAAVSIDTGQAGIHEGGTAMRMDDVSLPLRSVLDDAGARSTIATIRVLRERVQRPPRNGIT